MDRTTIVFLFIRLDMSKTQQKRNVAIIHLLSFSPPPSHFIAETKRVAVSFLLEKKYIIIFPPIQTNTQSEQKMIHLIYLFLLFSAPHSGSVLRSIQKFVFD